MKVQVENVMKVIDVLEDQVSPETIAFFENANITRYEDQSELGEDLFPCTEFEEEIPDEVGQLLLLAAQHDAAYVRFINL